MAGYFQLEMVPVTSRVPTNISALTRSRSPRKVRSLHSALFCCFPWALMQTRKELRWHQSHACLY
ncbi:hypothetical protein Plhal304r1_c004g0017011 [Plasmopara halstedii]